jgi:hypothetical protein
MSDSAPRKWTCRQCGKPFTPKRPYKPGKGQYVVYCSPRCNAHAVYARRKIRRRKGRPFLNLLHQQFGNLTTIAYAGTNKRSDRLWRVCCSLCNKTKVMKASMLRAGRCKSCGCVRAAKARARFKALHFLEQHLGADAMAGIERASQMAHGDHALNVAISAVGQMNQPNGPDMTEL